MPIDEIVDRDLTALARAGALPVAHRVDPVVLELESLLVQGGKHPMLAGEPGVGKTAIVQELARRIVSGRCPEPLAGMRVVEVALGTVVARAGGDKQQADLFQKLLDTLASERTLVVLREVGWLRTQALAPIASRALRTGPLRFLLEAEPRHAEELLKSDETMAEHIHKIVVEEPSDEALRAIVGQVAGELEAGGVEVLPSACEAAIRLSTKFLLARRQPRKALELLRESVARAISLGETRLAGDGVLTRFCEATRLPVFIVDDRVPLDLADTDEYFQDRILGQPEAVSAVLRSVALLKAGLNDPRRPLGVFLFAGPTGVGKTHLGKLLAEYLFGTAERLVRVNMADYPDDGDEMVLFGSPWASNRDGKRGELSRLLDGKAFAVLLLDEFEKAAKPCHDRFLQLFDEGRFINALGETVPCNNTLIIATSNAGAEVYREPPLGFEGDRSLEAIQREVDRRISQSFRPEFLNRFDAICHFRPLGRVEIRRIAQREVGRVIERDGIRARGLDVEVEPDVVDALVERGYSPVWGARFLQREIEKTLTSALAIEIAKRALGAGARVRVCVRGANVVATTESMPAEAAPVEVVDLPRAGAVVQRRKLDAAALAAEAMDLVAAAARVAAAAGRDAIDARRAELLAQVQSPTFWDDPVRAAGTLREFRASEAELENLDRVARACAHALRRARAVERGQGLAVAARAVEEAAREVRLAEALVASGAHGVVDELYLDIEAIGEGERAWEWLAELAQMYAGWAAKRGYEAEVLGETSSTPVHVVLRISGPGVRAFLAAEAGVHRRVADGSRAAAYVRVLEPRASAGDDGAASRGVKRRRGRICERIDTIVSARDQASGREVVLEGAAGDPLAAVAASLVRSRGAVEEVRRYHIGRGARVEDPRTGEQTPRIKDVLRGEIDQFIAAWITHSIAGSTTTGTTAPSA